MITKSLKPLILGIIGLSLVMIMAQFFRDDLAFQRLSISLGQWWLILSGNLVHSNVPHLFLNIAGLWIFGFLFFDNLSLKTFLLSCLLLCGSVGIGLYLFNPELQKYYGFSGALYGLFLVGATTSIINKDWFTGIIVALFIAGKIGWDFAFGASESSADLIGIPVAVHAHLYGAIGAIIISTGLYLSHLRALNKP
ncbi:MAG: rhombosortase [Cocleimonas sp.]